MVYPFDHPNMQPQFQGSTLIAPVIETSKGIMWMRVPEEKFYLPFFCTSSTDDNKHRELAIIHLQRELGIDTILSKEESQVYQIPIPLTKESRPTSYKILKVDRVLDEIDPMKIKYECKFLDRNQSIRLDSPSPFNFIVAQYVNLFPQKNYTRGRKNV